MIAPGDEPSSASALLAAARAARAQERSVSISVRVGAGASAGTIAALAPALTSDSHSSRSAVRSPSVEPSETISTSSGPLAHPAGRISGDGAAHALRAGGLEARRAQQRHRPHRRGSTHVEAGTVALLDRLHRRILATPRERPDDREAGGYAGDLRG